MSKKPKYYVRPDGLHEAIRVIGGKRVAFRGKTDAEVEQKMIAYKGAVERGRLFKDVAEQWKDEHFPTLAPNTLKSYKPAWTRAVNEFGQSPIKEIKAPDIKKFIVEFSRGNRARKTVTTQLLIINMIFGRAVENGEIEYNPCAYVTIPKNLPKTRRDAATAQDEQCIKNATCDWMLPYLILYTGLRKGEALALQGKDIYIEESYIAVTKSVYHINNQPYMKQPKTEAGTRTAPILDPLKNKLPKLKPDDYWFSDDGGKTPLTEMQYQRHWREYAEQTGISCTAHQLRHSFATMLFENDISVKDAQDLLGHSTAAMTQDVYTHLRSDRKKQVVYELNKRLADSDTH